MNAEVMIMGDFNIDLYKKNDNTFHTVSIKKGIQLCQLVREASRVPKHLNINRSLYM